MEHDVLATSQTRAKSRAISDLIGAGEISAEELTFDQQMEDEPLSSLKDIENATLESLKIPSAKKMHSETFGVRQQSGESTSSLSSEDFRPSMSTGKKSATTTTTQRFESKFEGKSAPIREDEGPFTKFFINKICKAIVARNPAASFEPEKNSSAQVVAVVWRNLHEEKSAREISNTLDWTVRKALESREKQIQ